MYYNLIIYFMVQIVFNTIQSESFFLSSRDYRFLIRRFLDPYPTLRRLSDTKTPSLNDRRPSYGSHETVGKETYRKSSQHDESCGHRHRPYEYDVNRELRQNYNKYLDHGDYHKPHYNHHHDSHKIPADYHRRDHYEKCRHPDHYHPEHFHRDSYFNDAQDDHYNRRGYEVQAQRHRSETVSKGNPSIHSSDNRKYKQEDNTRYNRRGEVNAKHRHDDEFDINVKHTSDDDKSNYESTLDISGLLKEHLKNLDKKITKDYVSGILVVVPKVLDEKSSDNADIGQEANYETFDKSDHSLNQENDPNFLQNYFLKNYSQSNIV